MSLKSVLVLACVASASAFSKLRACAGFNYDECGVCRGPGIAPGTCDCDGTLPDCANICGGTSTFDVCGVCGGPGLTGGICDCLGNVDVGCGCGEPGPSGCDNECFSELEYDECGVCGGIGVTDQMCNCVVDGEPDFSCIPDDPFGFEIRIDSQAGDLPVDKTFTFRIGDKDDWGTRSRALVDQSGWCIQANCQNGDFFPPGGLGCNDCEDGDYLTTIVGMEVKVTQELTGISEVQIYSLEEIFAASSDRYLAEFKFERERTLSIDIKSCGAPRFNEQTFECDSYETWTSGQAYTGEEISDKCFSNVCTGMPEFSSNGEQRDIEANTYIVQVRSVGCEGEFTSIEDPINTCTGSIRKGSFDDYCYEDLVYDINVKDVDGAAEEFKKRGNVCENERIEEVFNVIAGTEGQGVFVIDFNRDCANVQECVDSCPDGISGSGCSRVRIRCGGGDTAHEQGRKRDVQCSQ